MRGRESHPSSAVKEAWMLGSERVWRCAASMMRTHGSGGGRRGAMSSPSFPDADGSEKQSSLSDGVRTARPNTRRNAMKRRSP